jgi:hypothetical protein
MADGKRVETPGNAFNELLPRFASGAPAYNHLREMAVTHTGLEVGATIHLDYSIQTTGDMLPFFMGMEKVRKNVPVDEMVVMVKVPKGQPLRYKILNIRTAPDIFEEDGMMVYRWAFRAITPSSFHQYADQYDDPVVFFTIARDLQWAMFKFVDQQALRMELPPELQMRAVEAAKTNRDELKLMLELQKIVLNELNHKEIPPEYTGFRIRTPAETWRSGWATASEKSVILSRMLIAAGTNAEPVAVVPKAWYDDRQGNLFLFEDYAVQVNPKRLNRIYLSVNRQQENNLKWVLDEHVMIQLDAAVETMRTFDEEAKGAELKLSGTILVDSLSGASGSYQMLLVDRMNPWFSLSMDTAYAKQLLNKAGKVEGPEMKKLTEHEADITLSSQLQPEVAASYANINLPLFRQGIDSWGLTRIDPKEVGVVSLPHPVNESYAYSVSIPEGFKFVTGDEEIHIANDAGEVNIKIVVEEGRLTMERGIVLKGDRFDATNMGMLNDLIDNWNMKTGRQVVLKKVD